MKRLFFTAALCIGISIGALAQNELEREILGIRDSSEMIVRNSRKLVNTRLHEHNFTDLTKIVNYAKNNVDSFSYIAFYPWEEQVLSILSEDTETFLRSAADSTFNQFAIYPQEDYLGQYAISIILDEKAEWINWYNNLDLGTEQKQVIRVFLGAIGLFTNTYDNYNITKGFLKKYPNSSYQKYVLPFKKTFNFGTFEFEFGGGPWSLKGDLSRYVSPSTALSFGMGGFSNKFYWSMYFMGAPQTELLLPIEVTDDNDQQITINSGEELSFTNFGFKAGWLVYRNSWVKLYPVINTSVLSIELPAQDENNGEALTISTAFGLGAGICSDFDIIHWEIKESQSTSQSHLGIRISAGYQQFFADKTKYNGGGYYGAASLVWWLGSL